MITSIMSEVFKGGIWNIGSLSLGLVILVLITTQFHSLFVIRKLNQKKSAQSFETAVRNESVEDYKNPTPLERLALIGSRSSRLSKNQVTEQMLAVMYDDRALVEKKNNLLFVLGLFVSIFGVGGCMQGIYISYMASGAGESPKLLTAGVSFAMSATVCSLMVSVPTLIIYSIFRNRIDLLYTDLGEASIKIFSWADPSQRKNRKFQ